MIYDCFTFFNELDLLEIRLNVLGGVVDRFVLVESTRTFTNKPKRLFYEENKERFAKFADRIEHVVVDSFPPFTTAWLYESHQRNQISTGLLRSGAKADDVVLISDVDEIPDPDQVRRYANTPGVKGFRQDYFCYYLNFRNVRQQAWVGTKMLSYTDFLTIFDGVEVMKNEFLPEEINQGTTPSKIRMRPIPKSRGGCRIVAPGGWHFTSLGGAETLALKMRSFSHQEFNPGEERISIEELERKIKAGESPFWKVNCFGVSLDGYFPAYIQNNAKKYAHLVFPITEDYLRRVRLARFVRTFQGHAIRIAEWACPSSFHNFLHRLKMLVRKC